MIHPKAALIERLQKEGRGQPQFVTQREGPDHEPTFRSQVKVQGKVVGKGEGGNKREAERRAAESALTRLDGSSGGSGGGAAAPTPAGGGKRKRKTSATTPSAPAATAPAATAQPTAAQPSEAADEAPTSPAQEAFAGPWPVFDRALAESLRIAHERVDADLRGDVALAGIEAFALRLYKDVLEDLGEVVEEEA